MSFVWHQCPLIGGKKNRHKHMKSNLHYLHLRRWNMQGTQYSNSFGTWDAMLVQTSVRIILLLKPTRQLWIQRIWHIIRGPWNKVNTNRINQRPHSLHSYNKRRHICIDQNRWVRPLCIHTHSDGTSKIFLGGDLSGYKFQGKVRRSLENLDIFAYVNSKFIYVKRYIKTQLTTLYVYITKQKSTLDSH